MDLKFYTNQLTRIRDSIPEEKRPQFDEHFVQNSKNPAVVFGFSYWLGWLGVDRFMLGHTGLGILKLLTLGGVFIWYIVDLFLVGGMARNKNIALANELRGTLAA